MKLTIICLLISCSSSQKIADIVYFFPESINEELTKEIDRRKNNKIYLVLDKDSLETYVLYISDIPDSKNNIWLKYSNRTVYLNGQSIPLYFYSDEYFSYAQKGSTAIKNKKNERVLTKHITIRENYLVKFNSSGKIIK